MNLQQAKSLIEGLDGDEHAWADFKKDYHIGGIGYNKAEFLRDISALANTITGKPKHYLIIGVNDDGVLVGITPGQENYQGSGPRHIFSYDESDIQELIDSNLDPTPSLNWHTFEEDGKKFGILVVEPLSEPPTFISQHVNDERGNRLLHEGLIYVRKGSGKKIAKNEELESIIRYRIEKQREQILDGIHQAIDIGPEWVERIGKALPEEPGIPVATTEDPNEANVEITQRITRDPASTLDQQLNEDIAQWRGRGDDYVDSHPLFEYYFGHNNLRMDNVAVKFLTQASVKNKLMGIFWLRFTDQEKRREILLDTPNQHFRIKVSAKTLLLMNDKEGFEALINKHSLNTSHGDLRKCKQKMDNTIQNRLRFVRKNSGQYELKHRTFSEVFNPGSLSQDEIVELIPEVADELIDLQKHYEERRLWTRREMFFDALWDLETELAKKIFD